MRLSLLSVSPNLRLETISTIKVKHCLMSLRDMERIGIYSVDRLFKFEGHTIEHLRGPSYSPYGLSQLAEQS